LDWLHDLKDQPDAIILPENEPPDLTFFWTGSATNLLEMALSSHATGSINNGNISLKEVVTHYFKMFGMKMPINFSSTYGIMRLRPESRTLFLDKMKADFELKMDRDDEKERVRKKHH
jgi:hypothetical protein